MDWRETRRALMGLERRAICPSDNAFREVGIGRYARGIELFGAPFWSDFEQECSLPVDGVYLLEVARERPVPRVRTSQMLTYECEPDLETCFDFQSRRRALSGLPFAERTALAAAAFVFFQNCLLGMLETSVHNIA